jgi:CRP-like cAMP-binding protein
MAQFVRRLLRALSRRVGQEYGVVEDLVLFRDLEVELQTQYAAAVAGLRKLGYSNTDIARVLGVSRQAVAKRWPEE